MAAFDNRIGTFAVAEALRLLRNRGAKINAEVCAVSNVQEKSACSARGRSRIRSAGHRLGRGCDARDGLSHGEQGAARGHQDRQRSGHHHGGCNHPDVVARLEQVAKTKKIPLQHEAMSSTSGTDTDVIFWTRGGIASALISLPNRYMHSPVEVEFERSRTNSPTARCVCAHRRRARSSR